MCLDIVNNGTANKSLVQLYPCSKGANQVFNINSNGSLVNPTSGRCLDDPGGSTTNGTQLQIFDCNGGPNQTWLMPQQGAITSSLSGKCLDDKGGSPNAGTHVDSFACNSNFSQQWSIYNNLIKFDGRCVSVVGGATGNGSLVDTRGMLRLLQPDVDSHQRHAGQREIGPLPRYPGLQHHRRHSARHR